MMCCSETSTMRDWTEIERQSTLGHGMVEVDDMPVIGANGLRPKGHIVMIVVLHNIENTRIIK